MFLHALRFCPAGSTPLLSCRHHHALRIQSETSGDGPNQSNLLPDDVSVANDAVDLVKRLLKLHPLSQRPPGATAASTQASAYQPDRWPTPKSNEWQDIQLVFLKACITLTWALSIFSTHTSQEHFRGDSASVGQLSQLMQLLAIGHMPDMDLDMRKLFKVGMRPVLGAQYFEHPGYSGFTIAMLSRLARDCSLMPQSLDHALGIGSLFCESSQTVCFAMSPD